MEISSAVCYEAESVVMYAYINERGELVITYSNGN